MTRSAHFHSGHELASFQHICCRGSLHNHLASPYICPTHHLQLMLHLEHLPARCDGGLKLLDLRHLGARDVIKGLAQLVPVVSIATVSDARAGKLCRVCCSSMCQRLQP